MALNPGPYPLDGCKLQRGDIIKIENAEMIWMNFSGEKDEFNTAGQKLFNLKLTKEQADDLAADGWNVKCKLARPDDEDPEERCVLKVTVNFKVKPPLIKMIGDKSRNVTVLTEDIVGTLDSVDIKTADLTFVPYFWTMFAGKPNEADGVSAYLKSLYVEVIEDDLAEKWANL